MTDEEILGKIKKSVSEAIESPPMGFISNDAMHIYLMLQILDMLDNINTKVAMMNINIQDVEQEVSKLNPEYKR